MCCWCSPGKVCVCVVVFSHNFVCGLREARPGTFSLCFISLFFFGESRGARRYLCRLCGCPRFPTNVTGRPQVEHANAVQPQSRGLGCGVVQVLGIKLRAWGFSKSGGGGGWWVVGWWWWGGEVRGVERGREGWSDASSPTPTTQHCF